jgi:capsular polysaccharide biosynthesis protein
VEIDEIMSRLTRRYWHMLLLLVVASVVATGMWVSRQPPQYTAMARVAVSAQVPKSASEAAALVSQVQALATSPDIVAQAFWQNNVDGRDAQATAANAVSVTGDGGSGLVDIAVTDKDAQVATTLAGALAQLVTAAFDQARIGRLPSVIAGVDQQLDGLAAQRAPVAVAVTRALVAKPPDPRLLSLQSDLAGIDKEIGNLSTDRSRLAAQLAAAGHATVVTAPHQPSRPAAKGMAWKLPFGGIVGLAIGLIIATISETVRPTVSGAARLAQLLAVPLLGRLSANPAALNALGRRIRLAARRDGVSHMVVTNAAGGVVPEWIVDRLVSAVLKSEGNLDTMPSEAMATVGPQDDAAELRRSAPDANRRGTAPVDYQLSSLEELTPAAEADHIGVLVIAGGSTNAAALHEVRDLLNASGWPLLGVIAQPWRDGS